MTARNLLGLLVAGGCLLAWLPDLSAAEQRVQPRMVHLRSGMAREWSSFPEQAEGPKWEQRLPKQAQERAWTLRLRQQDVKQAWRVLLNDRPLGELLLDERDALRCFAIDAGTLAAQENVLRIEPKGTHALSDDIRVGEIELIEEPLDALLHQRRVEVEVTDADSSRLVPCCLTIVDPRGVLVPVGAASNDQLAVRTGIVYTATGRAEFGLPAGEFTIYAGRGFEYSRAQTALNLTAAGPQPPGPIRLTLRREVPVPGYVACDTHIHTLTHSGHGDATLAERMITLAGEGIEFPIATDHNVHVDYEAEANRLGVRQYFTPVIGNEYTTKVGHFNIFPIAAGARVPDAKLADWPAIFREIEATPGVRVAILNHARDLHSGTRPFGPALFNAVVAEQLQGWPLRFNAMEVINSGATQSDPLALTRDWMALLNRGYSVTPVGSSDSHDVTRFVVGQGRTYIRTGDSDPGRIDVANAIESFRAGRVLVSYGLLVELRVGKEGAAGDLVKVQGENVEYEINVQAPHWIKADRRMLLMNGHLVLDSKAVVGTELGKSRGHFTKPLRDFFLTAVATGPGIAGPYWQTAKPYQPTSPDPATSVYGCSGAIFVDADGDGRWSSAREYAERLWANEKDLVKLLPELQNYDMAVSQQVAHLFHTAGGDLEGPAFRTALDRGGPLVRSALTAYVAAWRECELARAAAKP